MTGALVGLAIIALAFLLIFFRKAGKDAVRAAQSDGVLKDGIAAAEARDRLKSDLDYADRVRKRFTR